MANNWLVNKAFIGDLIKFNKFFYLLKSFCKLHDVFWANSYVSETMTSTTIPL